MMPEHKIGVVIFANTSRFGFRLGTAAAALIYDVLLDKPGGKTCIETTLADMDACATVRKDPTLHEFVVDERVIETASEP